MTDGLKGMEGALAAAFPQTTLQTCIVHLLRQSLDFANWTQRKPLATALRMIYTAPSADLALAALEAFERGEWGQRFPTIVAAWRRAWSRVVPFFAFPPEIGASFTRRMRSRACTRSSARSARHAGIFRTTTRRPSYVAGSAQHHAKWERAAPTWRQALNQVAILYGDRFLPLTT